MLTIFCIYFSLNTLLYASYTSATQNNNNSSYFNSVDLAFYELCMSITLLVFAMTNWFTEIVERILRFSKNITPKVCPSRLLLTPLNSVIQSQIQTVTKTHRIMLKERKQQDSSKKAIGFQKESNRILERKQQDSRMKAIGFQKESNRILERKQYDSRKKAIGFQKESNKILERKQQDSRKKAIGSQEGSNRILERKQQDSICFCIQQHFNNPFTFTPGCLCLKILVQNLLLGGMGIKIMSLSPTYSPSMYRKQVCLHHVHCIQTIYNMYG